MELGAGGMRAQPLGIRRPRPKASSACCEFYTKDFLPEGVVKLHLTSSTYEVSGLGGAALLAPTAGPRRPHD